MGWRGAAAAAGRFFLTKLCWSQASLLAAAAAVKLEKLRVG